MCADKGGSTVPVERVGDRPGPVRHLAVDLGASGGRVALGTIQEGKLAVEILHRWPHAGISVNGKLYWDVLAIWRETLEGLKRAGGSVVSVGVNSWGVDYGLLDAPGNLLEGVHHYRCGRTDGVMEPELQRIGHKRVYEATGIQFMGINTAYQLVAHRRNAPALFEATDRMLNVPDLFHYWLSGEKANERTIASTTQLYDPRSRDWSDAMIDAFGLPRAMFGEIRDPGTILGEISPDVAQATGLHGTQVVLPASHDTASAVAATPAQGEDWAYVSSGTWSLVGIESPGPVVTKEAMEENLTNEAGYGGTTRLLKNVMGLWILQECRRAWGDVSYDELYAEAEAAPEGPAFDPDDARFLAPGTDMPERVRGLCEVGTRAETTRAIFQSLANKTASILGALERVSGRSIHTVHVVGGGSQIPFLNRLIEERAERRVIAGPVEATLMGNLLVQAEACGSIAPGSIRDVVRRTVFP